MSFINNENKRLYFILLILFVTIILFILYGIFERNIILKEVEKLINSSNPNLIYLMRDDCGYCELNQKNIELLENDYDLKYYKINTNKLTKNDLVKLLDMLNIDSSKFGTPHMVIVQNGKSIDSLSGLTTYSALFDFLKENSIIAENSKLYLNYSNLDEYNKLINSNTNEVIVLALSYCKYCIAEHPTLVDIAKKYNVKINYIYLDYLFSSKEEYDEFLNSLKWYSENEDWGTPTILIVNNKEVKKSLENYRDKDDIIEFFKDNGIIM